MINQFSRFSASHLARIVTPTATAAADPRQWNKSATPSNHATVRSSPFHSSSLSSSSITAASIVNKKSSSHSSSSTSSASSSFLAFIAAGALVGGAVIASDNQSSSLTPSAAASASSPPPTPTINFQLPDAADHEKQPLLKKPSDKKKPSDSLKKPGKFDHPLRDSTAVLSVPVFGGAKFQWAYPYFHPDAEKELSGMMDKQLTSMMVVSLGDPQGSNAMLHVISQLGQAHEMRAMWDTNGATTGKYKYRGDRFAFKSEFQLAPMYNGIMVGGDYFGDTWTGQAYLIQGQELELSFVKSLPYNITGGVQLRHVLGQQTILDGIVKLSNDDNTENIVLAHKMNTIIGAYTRRLDPFCSLATEYRFNTTNHESQCVIGVLYRRPNSFTYQANLHSGGVVSVSCEQTIVPGVIFGVTGAMVHDGSNESQFGFSFTLGG